MDDHRKLIQLLTELTVAIDHSAPKQVIDLLKEQLRLELCPAAKQPGECTVRLSPTYAQPGNTGVNSTATTSRQFDSIVVAARDLFVNKIKDYGPSWILLRWESLVDQIWIKASRIRTLQELEGKKSIPEDVDSEFIGIINYSVIALIKLWYGAQVPYAADMLQGKIITVDPELMASLYNKVITRIKDLLLKKNHDYGEAWRDMDIVSITDQIFVKLYRIKTILKNSRKLEVSEDIDAQFSDIINYAVFALVKLAETT